MCEGWAFCGTSPSRDQSVSISSWRTSTPPRRTSPPVASKRRGTRLTRVDFPAPVEPTIATVSPGEARADGLPPGQDRQREGAPDAVRGGGQGEEVPLLLVDRIADRELGDVHGARRVHARPAVDVLHRVERRDGLGRGHEREREALVLARDAHAHQLGHDPARPLGQPRQAFEQRRGFASRSSRASAVSGIGSMGVMAPAVRRPSARRRGGRPAGRASARAVPARTPRRRA